MPAATLTFNLPSEEYEFRVATRACELARSLRDIAHKIRQRTKYEGPGDEELRTLHELREMIPFSLLNEGDL